MRGAFLALCLTATLWADAGASGKMEHKPPARMHVGHGADMALLRSGNSDPNLLDAQAGTEAANRATGGSDGAATSAGR